jgi:hypothetical protein
MTEERNALTDLFAACWKDDALKARFMADPKAVLAERGIEMPDGMDVTVVENSDNTVHITLPMAPDGHAELSDEELSNAAGGTQNTGATMLAGCVASITCMVAQIGVECDTR